LNEIMLHDWMGVKTGTVITMMNSITNLKRLYPDELSDDSYGFVEEETMREHHTDDNIFQAGGHGNIQRVKPGIIKKKASNGECEFYLKFQNSTDIPDDIKTFFPKFEKIIEEPGLLSFSKKFILIEDLTYGMKHPCIMDIKMGTRTAGEDSNIFKKNFMINKDKSTTSFNFGLRLVALRSFNKNTQGYYQISRSQANEINNKELLQEALHNFFRNGEAVRLDVINYYIKRLAALFNWMKEQTHYRFYSSSLLFVYDGVTDVEKIDVRMIDFAHVFEIKDGGNDQGYVKGLKQLLRFLEKFLAEDSTNVVVNSS